MTNALTPLEAPFAPDIAAILKQYPQQDGYLLTLFRTFANSRRFLEKGVPNLLDKESPLPLRIRELTILRVTANNNCEYEWGVHVTIFAGHAGFSEDEIKATCDNDTSSDLWPPKEAALLRAIDQLCHNGVMSDDVLAQFQKDWTAEEQLEILALCGTYHTVSFVANTARLANEPFGARFPEE